MCENYGVSCNDAQSFKRKKDETNVEGTKEHKLQSLSKQSKAKESMERDQINDTESVLATFLLQVEYDGTKFCGFQSQRTASHSRIMNISELHKPFQQRDKKYSSHWRSLDSEHASVSDTLLETIDEGSLTPI